MKFTKFDVIGTLVILVTVILLTCYQSSSNAVLGADKSILDSELSIYKVERFFYAPKDDATYFSISPYADIVVFEHREGWVNLKIETKSWIIIPPGNKVEGWVKLK